jgi:hypothetical protein
LVNSALAGGDVSKPGDLEECMGRDSGKFADCVTHEFSFTSGEFRGEREGVVCENFVLTRKDVDYFFQHAVLIDGYTLEKAYSWFPCWFQGTLLVGDNSFKWTISPSGKGNVSMQGKTLFYLVCDEGCEEAFPEGGDVFRELS